MVSLRIAIADDDGDCRTVLVRLLKLLGREVPFSVGDGDELVDCCGRERVDLVFCDFHLPRMDGLAAAEVLADSGLPVVIVSGHADAESIVVASEPIKMVIRKPATLEAIREAIEKGGVGCLEHANAGVAVGWPRSEGRGLMSDGSTCDRRAR